jgi:hypothetical protein
MSRWRQGKAPYPCMGLLKIGKELLKLPSAARRTIGFPIKPWEPVIYVSGAYSKQRKYGGRCPPYIIYLSLSEER